MAELKGSITKDVERQDYLFVLLILALVENMTSYICQEPNKDYSSSISHSLSNSEDN